MADARNLRILMFIVFLHGKFRSFASHILSLKACIIIIACSPTLYPVGEVNVCPGDTRVFTCQVSMAINMVSRIEWLIQFEALDLSDILQSYILADPLGDVHIDFKVDTHLHSTWRPIVVWISCQPWQWCLMQILHQIIGFHPALLQWIVIKQMTLQHFILPPVGQHK